jgi:hypothetical protein
MDDAGSFAPDEAEQRDESDHHLTRVAPEPKSMKADHLDANAGSLQDLGLRAAGGQAAHDGLESPGIEARHELH